MMTPGQYSRLSSRDFVKSAYNDDISYSDLFVNEQYGYDVGLTANGSIPSSTAHHPQHLNNYEYEKPQKRPNPSLQQYRYHNHHRHKHRRRKNSKGEDIHNNNDDDDDDDKYKCGFWPIFFCGVGVLVAVVLILLLCNYVERKTKVDKEEKQNLEISLTYLDVKNDIYFHRIARTIMSAQEAAAEKDSGRNWSNEHRTQLKSCDLLPPTIQGETQDVHLNIEVDIDNIIKSHSDIQAGGEWKPPNCISRHRLAIIIPYRDRWSHLKVLLYYLLPVLKRQQIHFRIFVVEQYGNQTFNKGRIMNAAYREALKLFDFQCVTFHDVDLVPEDDRNIYTCAEHPKHMSTAIDKFNYHLPYAGLVGGVLSFRVDHFQLVNGYSNMYWGWGGEDDDMTNRIMSKGLRIFRPPNNVARYKMVKHNGRPSSQIRLKLLRTAARRGRVEGLNNVPYNLLFAHNEKLFTHFMVDVGQP